MRRILLLIFLLAVLVSPAMAGICNPQYLSIYFNGGNSVTLKTQVGQTTVSYAPSGSVACLDVLGEEYVSKAEYYYNGKLIGSAPGGYASNYNFYYFNFPNVTLGLGTHGFTVKLYMNQGIFEKSQIVKVVAGTGNPIEGSVTTTGLLGPVTLAYAKIEYPLEGQRITLYKDQGLAVKGYGYRKNVNGYVSIKLDGNDAGSATLNPESSAMFTIPLPSSISEGSHRLDVYLTGGGTTKYIGSVNFTIVRGPTLTGTVMVNTSQYIVGAPGNWCKKAGDTLYLCGDADPVAIKVPDLSFIRRSDPEVMPPNKNLLPIITTLYGPPSTYDIWFGTWNIPCTDCAYRIDHYQLRIFVKPINADEVYTFVDDYSRSIRPVFKYYKTDIKVNFTFDYYCDLSPQYCAPDYVSFKVYSGDTWEYFGGGDWHYNSQVQNITITMKPASKYVVIVTFTNDGTSNTYTYEITSVLETFEPVYFIPPPDVEIYAIDYETRKTVNRFVLSNGSTVDLSYNTPYCKYKATFVAGDYVDTCCLIHDEVFPVGFRYGIPEYSGQYAVAHYITRLDPPPTPPSNDPYFCFLCSYVDSRPVTILFALTHPANLGAYTGTIVTVSGVAKPLVMFSTMPLNFRLPVGEVPLNQKIVPIGVQRAYYNWPHGNVPTGWGYSVWACHPTNIKINGIPTTLSLIMYDWSKSFLINPVANRPGVTEEREHLVEYLTVDTLRSYYSYYVKIPLKRGVAYLEGTTLDMVFHITTSTPIVNATFWNASNPNLKISCSREGAINTIVRKDFSGSNVTISCEITDPMKNVTIRNWVALDTSELWYLEVCNEEGLCNQTYVNILGAKALDVQINSLPPPTPGSLSVKITYPEYGATVSPGQLTAKATASVSGGYGTVKEVDFSFQKWDSSLGWLSQCDVTRTSPDSGSTYSAQCEVTEGKWKLTVFAKDSNGKLVADSVEFNVKSGGGGGGGGGGDGPSGPAITEFKYPMQCVVDGTNVTITFSAYSPNGLKSARLYADGVLVAEKSLSGHNANSVQMTFRANFNGKQYIMLRLVVVDTLGLSHETTGMIVPCELCPDMKPNVRFIDPPSNATYWIPPGQSETVIPIIIEFSDDSAVKRVELHIDDVKYFGIDLNTKSGTLRISPDLIPLKLSKGIYSLRAVAVDGCGQNAYHESKIEVKLTPSYEAGNLTWVYTNFYSPTGSLAARNGSLLACMVNTSKVYSVGWLRYSETPSIQLEGLLTKSKYEGSCPLPSGDGQKDVGYYDRDTARVTIDWPCGAHVKWNIDPSKDYTLQFKPGCCRYECPTNQNGCVLVC
jgi:hypothetical protein